MPILSEISNLPPLEIAQNKKNIKAATKILSKELEELQLKMFAERKRSLLVILQGMDASGKGGTIRKVFKHVNPAGCSVRSFKKPSDEEMAHDFLWRIHQHAPPKGIIQLFDRSHYEDVLIQRVNKWIDEETVYNRFEQINNFEKLLQDTGCTVLKFYLHVSYDEQLVRLEERMTNPQKYWKHNAGDFEERQKWTQYMQAYEDVFAHCNKPEWHIIPSDKNWYKEYLIAQTMVHTLKSFDMQWPSLKK
ncbi:MAG: polyphosphate kinase [Chitinophagales bacterium]|nr:polyphosphate kinase [Bacteroidota bacterium]MCB9043594.1 polyphosphate kinase [Chitinophagales bacterium]